MTATITDTSPEALAREHITRAYNLAGDPLVLCRGDHAEPHPIYAVSTLPEEFRGFCADHRPPMPSAEFPGNRIPTVRIFLRRAEGRSSECVSIGFQGPHVWEQAAAQLLAWSFTAPSDGTYDKTDFEVTWADGVTYSGRFDLTRHDTNLPAHMRGFLTWAATEAPRELVTEEEATDAAEWLRTRQIGA